MNISAKSIIFILYLLAFCLLPASQSRSEKLCGPAFTDPAQTQEMPLAWQEKPIIHDTHLGRVDLVVNLDRQFMQFAPFIEKYAVENHLKIQINSGTCGTSLEALLKKNADITGYCCAPGKIDRLPGVQFHTIAIHPVSILLNKNNPVLNLSLAQAQRIFMGDIGRWSEVGGENIPILPVARLHCAKRPGHWRLLLDNADLFSPTARMVASIEDMFSTVASTPGAIGYEVMWQSAAQKEIKYVKIDGISPHNFTALQKGRYKLYRVLNLTTWIGKKLENPKARKLLSYLSSKFDKEAAEIGVVSAATLRANAWKFKGDELISGPLLPDIKAL